jgi:hypothetical protein
MTDLELILSETRVEFPPTPDLVGSVGQRIREAPANAARERGRFLRPGSGRRSLVIAFSSLLLLATGAVAAVPDLRNPVLEWLGLRSVEIRRVPKTPNFPKRQPGADLQLGRATTLAKARGQLPFTPVLPTGLGEPALYYGTFVPGGALSAVYRDGKLLVTEFEGRIRREYLGKFIGPDTRVERVVINGQPGLWLGGAPHGLVYEDSRGDIRTDSARIAGPTLLWRRGDLLLRIEGARSKAEALRIAGAVR